MPIHSTIIGAAADSAVNKRLPRGDDGLIGAQPLRFIEGWTDGPNCDGSNTYTANTNKPVFYTDQTSISFVKNLYLEMVPDVNMQLSLPPNTDKSLGWTVYQGSPTVSGSQLNVQNGDIAITTSLRGDILAGITLRLFFDVVSIGTGGFSVGISGVGYNVNPPIGLSTLDLTLQDVTGVSDFTIDASGFEYSVVLNSFSVKDVTLVDETLPATTSTASGNVTIDYDSPVWSVALSQVDRVYLIVGAGNNYVDSKGTAMGEQTIEITNCL